MWVLLIFFNHSQKLVFDGVIKHIFFAKISFVTITESTGSNWYIRLSYQKYKLDCFSMIRLKQNNDKVSKGEENSKVYPRCHF